MHKKLLAVAVALAASLVLTPTALAKGPGGGGSGPALTLVLMNSTDGLAHYGQNVTFRVSTTATTQPWVRLNCYQASAWVYSSTVGYFPSYPWDQYFTLSSGNWASGAASCTATLYALGKANREQDIASLSFPVYA